MLIAILLWHRRRTLLIRWMIIRLLLISLLGFLLGSKSCRLSFRWRTS